MDNSGQAAVFRYSHHGLLGTVVDVRVSARDERTAQLADDRVLAEIDRLERVFSAFVVSSELCRWRSSEIVNTSGDFGRLMGHAFDWHVGSNGRFNPLVGELSDIWKRAARDDALPDADELAAMVGAIEAPRFEMVKGVPRPRGDCSKLNLNAIAKGYIVDRALEVALGVGVEWASVNAGGDLAHKGSDMVRAGIENPHRPYDNEPPLMIVRLSNAALATSGDARRGFRVGGKWFGHVIDPLTGWPVDDVASISVVASNAETADVLATVAGVRSPSEARRFLNETPGAEGMIVDQEAGRWMSKGWADLVVS